MDEFYVVEESEDFSDEALAAKLNDLNRRGFIVEHVIEKDSRSGNGYTVIAYKHPPPSAPGARS